ncbi:metallophosphoesterase [Epilithonimonas sp.]|uniref:metallophosphoesterase family protein n=1 Tax=Epilithonimonas sp. TaxID=2894511 RepID=UPI0028A0BC52|nr:metallophosphoesterase [Epilithonimonas sp.]
MIKIAVISDIHANLLALEKVMEDIRKREISQIYCLGDLVDFAPWGNEVISLMKNENISCILGNHDERIAFNLPVTPLQHHDDIETESRLSAINYSKQTITKENKNWLSKLPFHIELQYKIGKSFKKIMLVHACIDSNEEYIYESDPKGKIISILKERSIDILVMGHTHQSYVQCHSNILLLNCGSVGRSKESDRKAVYSIITLSEENIDAEIIKIDYPVMEVASAIYASTIPNFYGDFLLEAK